MRFELTLILFPNEVSAGRLLLLLDRPTVCCITANVNVSFKCESEGYAHYPVLKVALTHQVSLETALLISMRVRPTNTSLFSRNFSPFLSEPSGYFHLKQAQ